MTKEKAPIIFIIYNRPDLTEKVLEAISVYQPVYQPERLYIVADGPKDNIDKILCDQTRAFINKIDWDCEIHKNYAETNMGCGIRVSSGITWAFETCDRAIILEDDCVPDLSFFPFCEELLERYKNDSRIGMISGNNYGYDLFDHNVSYSFSKHGHIWGWATWRRAWNSFTLDLTSFNEQTINNVKSNISCNKDFVNYWWKGAKSVMNGSLDSWDYQWGVIRYINNYLTIRPKCNLVANIGFNRYATHTKGKGKQVYGEKFEIDFPLVHPKYILPDYIADKMIENFFIPTCKDKNFYNKIKYHFKNIFK